MRPTTITQYASTSERGKFKEITTEIKSLEPHDALLKNTCLWCLHTDCSFMGQDGPVLGHEPIGKVIAVSSERKDSK